MGQAAERIARIRETAGAALLQLVPIMHKARVPDADIVVSALKSISNAEAFATGAALPALARLVTWEPATQAILEAFTFSIGGLDAQLAEDATEALVDAINEVSTSGDIDQMMQIGDDFVMMWMENKKGARLTTPLLITASILLSRTEMQALQPPDSTFLPAIMFLVDPAITGCHDVARLHAAARVLCALASASGADYGLSMSALTKLNADLMSNRYPKVRRYAAEELYTTLLVWERAWGVDTEGALELLSNTVWDGPDDETWSARMDLLRCLGLDVYLNLS
jgi:hypothetical protein